MLQANNPNIKSFINVSKDSDFPIQNLPFGIFSRPGSYKKSIGVAIGNYILDIDKCFKNKILDSSEYENFQHDSETLNPLMSLGRLKVRKLRSDISYILNSDTKILRDDINLQQELLVHQKDATMHLPVQISGYTDFYSSKEHAENIGRMFRDPKNPLLPNWLHIPVAYDGRAGSVVVSGTNIKRPYGQIKKNDDLPPTFEATSSLDVEVEMGTLIGKPSKIGEQISTSEAPDHVFGMVLVNDWSARDIQKWEYVPLGPFLGKNFATSISPWVVTLDALEPFRVESPSQDVKVLPYLSRSEKWGIDIQLELSIRPKDSSRPEIISKTNFKHLYWDMMQQVSHHSSNGCPLNTADLLASGTISGPNKDSFGSLIELTEGGKNPLTLSDGTKRTFLQDGDIAIINGYCVNKHYRIGFGQVSGAISTPSYKTSSEKEVRTTTESIENVEV